jgi:hypothetical protein
LSNNPIVLRPGQTRDVYIYSSIEDDIGIVYDNQQQIKTHDDKVAAATVSTTPSASDSAVNTVQESKCESNDKQEVASVDNVKMEASKTNNDNDNGVDGRAKEDIEQDAEEFHVQRRENDSDSKDSVDGEIVEVYNVDFVDSKDDNDDESDNSEHIEKLKMIKYFKLN